MELLLGPLVVFLAIITVASVAVLRHDQFSQRQVVLGRLARPIADDLEDDIDITRRGRAQESARFAKLTSKVRLIQRLEENLWQAGLYVKTSEAVVLIAVVGAAGAAIGAVWGGGFGFPALAAGIVAASLPLLYVGWRKRRRLRAFDQQLPEILDMIKSSLDAGHTLQRALQVAVEEFGDPASTEFRIVLEQNRLGVPLARALEYMLQRIPDENLRFLVVAVKIQTEVGSSLAGIMNQLSRTVRDRQRLEMKVRVLTAQPRISALIGGAMPLILLFGLSFIAPENVRMLFHDPSGLIVAKVAAALEVMAFVVIYRMMRVDY